MIAAGEWIVPAARFAPAPGHRDVPRLGGLVLNAWHIDAVDEPIDRIVAVVGVEYVVADVMRLR